MCKLIVTILSFRFWFVWITITNKRGEGSVYLIGKGENQQFDADLF